MLATAALPALMDARIQRLVAAQDVCLTSGGGWGRWYEAYYHRTCYPNLLLLCTCSVGGGLPPPVHLLHGPPPARRLARLKIPQVLLRPRIFGPPGKTKPELTITNERVARRLAAMYLSMEMTSLLQRSLTNARKHQQDHRKL